MPIEVLTRIEVLDQESFHALDRRIMRIVFNVHNRLGRLLNERAYRREIAACCEAAGLVPVEREVRIRVTHKGFVKEYAMDLLIAHGGLLEAKTAQNLVPSHRGQTLNYLFLSGLRHARLVNLRTDLVQHEFVSTKLTESKRRRFVVVDHDWHRIDESSDRLMDLMIELLEDWGGFLEIALYAKGITHFLGGPAAVERPVEIVSEGRSLGHQLVSCLADNTAFVLTAITENTAAMRDHQQRFLDHTPLEFMQWINMNHHDIEFRTLRRRAKS
jgi:GxxExxY protein